MTQETLAYVALGANLGDAQGTVRQALQWLDELPDTRLVRASSLYRTAPVDSSGPDYINAVAQVRTRIDAHRLLSMLQGLEQRAGRERPYPNAPRTLDLDLLLFGDAHTATAQLQLPHPRMYQRAFVLVPLAEIAPALVSPEQLQAVAGQGVTRMA